MSTTDPNPSTPPGWASRAPSSPDAVHDPAPPPPGNSLGSKATTVVGGMIPRLLGLALALAVAFGAYWFFVVHKNSQAVADSIPKTGSCFSWTDDAGAKVRPCTDPAALYKAEGSASGTGTAAGATCDSVGAYVEFGIIATARNNHASGTICAALNVKVGDCVSGVDTDPSVVPCTPASGADAKVVSMPQVASAAETLSDTKAMAVCSTAATDYLSDTAGRAIVCLGKP